MYKDSVASTNSKYLEQFVHITSEFLTVKQQANEQKTDKN